MGHGRRTALLATFAIGTLVLLVVCSISISSVLGRSVYSVAKRNAGQDAQLMTDLGLAAALLDGRLTTADQRAATAEFRAASHSHPLTGLIVWTQAGRVLFADGDGRRAADDGLPKVVRRAFSSGTTQTGYSHDRGIAPTIEAAVPIAQAGGLVAEFHFARAGVERELAAAKRRMYVLVAVAAALFYLAIFPLLARLVRRLPPPVDPRHLAAVARLRRGLERGELCMYYQPKICVETGAPLGVEALVRWDRPAFGVLTPATFLPDAERSPALMAAVTERTIDMAVGDCARWAREGRQLPVAVNIAASILLDGSVVATVRDALVRHGLDPALLTIEITEATIERGTDAAEVVTELRRLGVAVSIDDFGTGYSSLARLRSFPLDELKIDQTFVRMVAFDDRDLSIVELIADIGARFGLRVVAEGVEDEPTLELLRRVGCTVAQGYLFAPPLAEHELLTWIDDRTRTPQVAAS